MNKNYNFKRRNKPLLNYSIIAITSIASSLIVLPTSAGEIEVADIDNLTALEFTTVDLDDLSFNVCDANEPCITSGMLPAKLLEIAQAEDKVFSAQITSSPVTLISMSIEPESKSANFSNGKLTALNFNTVTLDDLNFKLCHANEPCVTSEMLPPKFLKISQAEGGGTVRDVILDVQVFWFTDLNYILVPIYSGAIAYVARGQFTRKQLYDLMLYLDGLGAALFGIQGTAKAWDLNLGLPVAPVILGLITAIGGGLIRDVLTGQKTLLMKRQFYAVPVVLASILFVVILTFLPQYRLIGSIGCVLVSFIFRSAAIRWNLTLPDWSTTKAKN